jgi:uncharacterized membrane protein (UPF0127 family)
MKINVKQLNIDVTTCNKWHSRLIGFMFKKENITKGLLFDRCNAIHTFFMYQPIDVVMTDIDNNILFTFENLKANKIILPKKGVYKTYELPVGSIKKILSIKKH